MSRDRKEEIPTRYVISVYRDLLIDIWHRAANIIGSITLEVLFQSAIRRISPYYPFLSQMNVSVNGLGFEKLEHLSESLPSKETKEGFQALVSELFSLFAAMCGDILVKELSPKLKEAESRIHAYKERGA